ncbi:MAG: 2-C-methyl-D-erythritol 4-phosphate cytidylyltransferase [Limnochordia bacterium]|jgi:2-C-methyl-D-erythritol 4-phosphate cytidylyltransferase/2-C-methyl-D-erythritol 2,4-cyclodiphosphate synthase|nr:2-C-methyl-D-erythritol 4-phosphate cytidylyltransferase [Limnochordia bacterium]
MSNTFCIVPAAGCGSRMGPISYPTKQYIELRGIPVLARTLMTLSTSGLVDRIIVAVRPSDLLLCEEEIIEKYGIDRVAAVIPGGATRTETVRLALDQLKGDPADLVVIHDGARPLLTLEDLRRVIEAAKDFQAAALSSGVQDTVKLVDHQGYVTDTLPRSRVRLVQTPQVFSLGLIKQAYAVDRSDATDDCALVEALGVKVKLIEGNRRNIKITTPEDVTMAEGYLADSRPMFRVGCGYDVHRLVPGRKLVLGGVGIPYSKGLLGHSDADCLLHAIMDAMLGAVGAGDIGRHFPDSDEAYAGISSLVLLERVGALLEARNFVLCNIDATVVAEQPRLSPHIPKMQQQIAKTLGLELGLVNIKATTTEGMGPAGEGQCIVAHAVVAVRRRD